MKCLGNQTKYDIVYDVPLEHELFGLSEYNRLKSFSVLVVKL